MTNFNIPEGANEYRGKTYKFDPENKQTCGLPVPAGFRLLGSTEAPAFGDIWCLVGDANDFKYELRCIKEHRVSIISRESSADIGDAAYEVVFRPLNIDADLAAKVPDTHEVYDRGGEPVADVTGWQYISDCYAGPAIKMWAESWPSSMLARYGDLWILARPKADSKPAFATGGVIQSHRSRIVSAVRAAFGHTSFEALYQEEKARMNAQKLNNLDAARDSTWMRGGYNPVVTTVGIDDMSGDDVCADAEDEGGHGGWEFL